MNQTLILACVVEPHLCAQFTIGFYPNVLSLKTILFDLRHQNYADNNNNMHASNVPVLFITAAFNNKMKNLLKNNWIRRCK